MKFKEFYVVKKERKIKLQNRNGKTATENKTSGKMCRLCN